MSEQLRNPLLVLPVTYILSLTAVLISPRLQRLLTYCHFFRPPNNPSLKRARLLSHSRPIRQKHLSGWHVLPSGPPFPTTSSNFDALLSAPLQRVFLFFHGTSGTRAFPRSRVDLIKLFSAHFASHVVVFDYSGFAESSGSPSERTLVDDATAAHNWVVERVHPTTDIVVYGMSLGSHPALSLAASQSTHPPLCLVLDSAFSTLLDAVMTHPVGIPIRIIPYSRALCARFLRERLDNTACIANVKIPVLILHGESDGQINVAQGRALYSAAREAGNSKVEFVGFPKCGHNDVAAAEGFLSVVWAFVEKCKKEEIV